MFDSLSALKGDEAAAGAVSSAGENGGVAGHGPFHCAAKRMLDVVIATTALIILMPAFVVIAVLVRLGSSGPILFRQRRIGLNGSVFRILKFRSTSAIEDGEATNLATRDDPRFTRLADFLRKSCLDELPQLINVILGHMSLVGPRARTPWPTTRRTAPFLPRYGQCFAVRPNLTGLAQMKSFRCESGLLDFMAQRVEAGVKYVNSWSVRCNILILFQTVP